MSTGVKECSKELEIVNALGLHARAASKLVSVANRYHSEVWVGSGDQEVNGKSILGVMMLACARGMKVSIRCVGEDAEDALSAICDLIRDGFGER